MTTNGLAVVRSLGRRGIPVSMLDAPRDRPAMRSRCGRAVPMPDLCAEPGAWLAKLLDLLPTLAGRAGPPVLVPTGDEHVLFVSEYRERLAPRARFRLPGDDLVRRICDKRQQFELSQGRGWPLPRTAVVEERSDVERLATTSIGFPCVLKPLASHRWMRLRTGKKLTVARDLAELGRNADEMWATGETVLLQELIPGGDDALHTAIAVCAAGEPLALFTKRKLRQYPIGCGNGSFQVTNHDREVAELSAAILRDLGWDGMVALELKRDSRDARLKPIEINPRGVSGNQLAIDAGLDLPFLAYQQARGAEVAPPAGYRPGVHYVHLAWDLLSFLAYRRRGELKLAAWLRSLARARSFVLFDPRDPAPSLHYALMVFRQWRRGSWKGRLLR